MGRVDGYIVANYLIQYASWERRYSCVPASTWDAVLRHMRDPADTIRLADSASNRLLYRYAIPLYRHAARRQRASRWRLVELLLPSAATWTRWSRSSPPKPPPGTSLPPGGWPTCWPTAATSISSSLSITDDQFATSRLAELLAARSDLGEYGPGPTPATGTPQSNWQGCCPTAATWTGRRRSCGPGPTRRRVRRRATGRVLVRLR